MSKYMASSGHIHYTLVEIQDLVFKHPQECIRIRLDTCTCMTVCLCVGGNTSRSRTRQAQSTSLRKGPANPIEERLRLPRAPDCPRACAHTAFKSAPSWRTGMREWSEPRGSDRASRSSGVAISLIVLHCVSGRPCALDPQPEDPRRKGRRGLKPIRPRAAADSDISSTGTSSSRGAPPPGRVPPCLGLNLPILEKVPALWDSSLATAPSFGPRSRVLPS